MRLVLAALLFAVPAAAHAAEVSDDIKATCTLLAAKSIPKLEGIRLKSSEVKLESRNDIYTFYAVRLETEVLGSVTKLYHRCRIGRGGSVSIVE
ncbi:hypothetical protein [Magnetospirillum sp. 15-1]|uniref:hypothetical protein n=1 Tax=Magnetospirillum sp. 15-1 TaxID=1979370 RepID=UPI000BBB9C55|nr:hypothetical protein [Magnetospirillum sp. 15-1]